MKHFSVLIFLFLLACNNNNLTEEQKRWEKHVANTEIIRDDFGVPHIFGKTDADAVFGMLYAQCEDDFKRIERNYIWATGRLAEIEGEDAIYSDLRANLFMTKDEALALYDECPDWLKKLCIAFADGINYYLHKNPNVKPQLITHFEPWMPLYFSEGSIGGDIETIATSKIKAFYGDNAAQAKNTVHNGLIREHENDPTGSNGFAISGKLTQSGNAMLLINPHTSFFFRGEIHVLSEEGLNAYGAVTWGQFFVYQGFNDKVGWMHTSTNSDFMDTFLETVTKTDSGYFYKYGDEQRKVESKEITLQYASNGTLISKTFTIYRTHHGPITGSTDDKWEATAMMWNPVDALTQSYSRTKANGNKAFRETMNYKTNSSNNTVYADADGNIAYYHGNFIPKRNPIFNYSMPVDGSIKETDWQGLHTVDEIINVTNPAGGWIQNCNSSPFSCAGFNTLNPDDYPAYMSRNHENFRSIHAISLLEKSKQLTLDQLIALAYSPYLTAFEQLIPGLIQSYDQTAKPDQTIKDAVEELRNWDFTVSKSSVAMTLAHFYASEYLQNGVRPKELSFIDLMQYFGTGSPREERIKLFKNTLQNITSDFGQWNTPWGEVNRFQRLDGSITQTFNDSLPSTAVGMASSIWGALASFEGNRIKNKRIYGTSGNSFVAVVEFGDKVIAKSMLVGGQSSHPDSPHFDDQIQPYTDVQFKNVAYYREDVEKRAKRKYRPGE